MRMVERCKKFRLRGGVVLCPFQEFVFGDFVGAVLSCVFFGIEDEVEFD